MKELACKSWNLVLCLVLSAAAMAAAACNESESSVAESGDPHIHASSDIEAGRYLVKIGACNDCHTPGFAESPNVPEEQWLTGVPMGWRGPWGTTYAANLRNSVQILSEDDWVMIVHTRTTNPPMPWSSLNSLSERDARAIYRYIRSLGPAGDPMPFYVPPDQEPTTPYLSMAPRGMPAQ